MDERTAQTRDLVLLSAAVVLGAALSAAFPIVGLPLVGMGAAGLVYRGRMVGAIVGAVIGFAVVVALGPVDAIFSGPALVAVLLAVVMLRRIDAQWVGAMLVAVLSITGWARDSLALKAQGTSIAALLSSEAKSLIAQSAGSSANAQALKDSANLLLSLIPMMYFVTGVLTAVVIIVAIAWAARRTGQAVMVLPLSRLDFTPHVLWPFIIGVLAAAVSFAPVANPSVWLSVGLNLVLCVRAIFALQGLGVAAGVLDRTHAGLGVRILVLAALAVLDVFTLAVSFIGLVDIWVNFRHLPRDGAAPSPPVVDMSGR